MSWDDIDGTNPQAHQQQAEARAKQAELVKKYARCFASDDGQEVLQDLTRRFLLDNATALNSQNINYESAYHNGEAGVVRLILHYIQQAEVL